MNIVKTQTLEVLFFPSYDHRDEPDDKYGCCSARMLLIYRGRKGVIACQIYTDWMSNPLKVPYHRGQMVPRERSDKPGIDAGRSSITLGPVDSHSKTKYAEWNDEGKDCNLLGIEKCYGDTGYTIADRIFKVLVSEGTEGVIREMKSVHDDWFKQAAKTEDPISLKKREDASERMRLRREAIESGEIPMTTEADK